MAKVDPIILQRARELRQPQTQAEEILWYHLRDCRLNGHKFRRQHPLGKYIVDFFCADMHLVIEVDGDTHAGASKSAYDAARTAWLERQGLHVLRFTNDDVYENLDEVLLAIFRTAKRGERVAALPA